jgi:hypothetical protein
MPDKGYKSAGYKNALNVTKMPYRLQKCPMKVTKVPYLGYKCANSSLSRLFGIGQNALFFIFFII